MDRVADRAGHPLAEARLDLLRMQLEEYDGNPYWRDKIVIDQPGADGDRHRVGRHTIRKRESKA